MHNGTMLQSFHWYSKADGKFWNNLKESAESLAGLGISSIWLPPAFKTASGVNSTGYDIYDLYDLGEFDQKNAVRTKYGTKQEYIDCIQSLQAAGISVIVDIVLNHKAGGDETEKFKVLEVDFDDRTVVKSDPFEIEAYTKFTFPGRGKKYSDFEWNYTCFTGVDHAVGIDGNHIYKIQNEFGDGWEEVIDTEKGNYDFLMYNDIEFRNPSVREELNKWGKWYHEQVKFDGLRLDAVKHITPKFYNEWLTKIRAETGKELFTVGEYWAPGQLLLLLKYIEATEGKMSLFDSSLHNNFHNASKAGNNYDMRQIFDDSLVKALPEKAVTVVDNHDTQPLQALEAPVEAWFKPLAYALILLRKEGYPCLFYPDLCGAHYTDKGKDGNDYEIWLPKTEKIEGLLRARKQFAYGDQYDYFDHGNCIGWTRKGNENSGGCAVLLTNGAEGIKKMDMGKRNAGKNFVDLLENHSAKVQLDENGSGDFLVRAGSVSVWVNEGDKNN